jgi:hypothetical protein
LDPPLHLLRQPLLKVKDPIKPPAIWADQDRLVGAAQARKVLVDRWFVLEDELHAAKR